MYKVRSTDLSDDCLKVSPPALTNHIWPAKTITLTTEIPVEQTTRPTWLQPILDAVRDKIPKDFVGQIEINCFKGGISNLNLKQSYKEDSAK